jgi:hypothetical protein
MPLHTPPTGVLRKVVCTVIASQLSLGVAHAQYFGYTPPPEQSLFEKFFLPVIGAAVGGIFGGVINMYGGKLISHLSSDESSVKPPPASPQRQPLQPAQYNIPSNEVGMMNTVYQPPAPTIPKDVKAVTGVMYVIDRLNSDYSIREIVTPQQGVAPTFESREKFAIRYTSNLPGVVVIMNVDALQKTSYLGTFVVTPGMEMRFPAETNKGMVLDDNVGLEAYQMLFMACLPPQMANQPDVMARKGQIPECGATDKAEQTILSTQMGRKAKGTFNEAIQQSDGTKNVMLSVAPYEKGDVTTTTFTINHILPRSQQQQQSFPLAPQAPMPSQQPQSGVTGTI